MPATTAVYPERSRRAPTHFRVHRGPEHARFWRDGVESTIGPAGLNFRRLRGVRATRRNPERSGAESKDLSAYTLRLNDS